jgi:DNA-binding transcriptional ArsR family regulator
MRLQNVSQHLRLMRNRGLVTRRRCGQEVQYRLADERLVQMLETMRKMIADSVQREETRG